MRISPVKVTGLIALIAVSVSVCRLDASATSSLRPDKTPTTDKPKSLYSTGQDISFAISSSGQLMFWGDDSIYSPIRGEKIFPMTVIPGLPSVTAVDSSDFGVCAVANNGRIICWGYGGSALGFGPDNDNILTPTVVPRIMGAIDVSLASFGVGCAVLKKGEVWCWGSNLGGVMGTGTLSISDMDRRYFPARVPGINNAVRVFALDHYGACAVLRDQQLRCWGGLVGLSKPKKLLTFSKARMIADTMKDTCLADNRGDVWCWGENKYGGAGAPEGTAVESPTQILGPKDVIDISMDLGTCALERNGGIWCWGSGVPNAESKYQGPTKIATIDSAIAIRQGFGNVCALTHSRELACIGYYNSFFGDAESAPMADTRLTPCRQFRVKRCAIDPYRVQLP